MTRDFTAASVRRGNPTMFGREKSAANSLTILYTALFLTLGFATSSGEENTTRFGAKPVMIHMGGFFAFPDNPYLAAQQRVAQTALDHVNSLDGILDGYYLEMRWNWTGAADPEKALGVLYTLTHTGPPVLITSGPHHSGEATIVNQVAARFNIVQIGTASAGSLADRSVYPYTVRAYPTDEPTYLAGAAFFRRMGWSRIAFIFEDSASFQARMKKLREVLEAKGIHIVASEGVRDMTKLDIHLQNLKRQDARITYIGFFKTATLKVYCQAYLSGMYGAKYVWIAPYWAASEWWVDQPPSTIEPCTAEQINSAVDTSIHFAGSGRHRQEDLTDIDYNGVKPLPEHYDYFGSLPSVQNVAHTYDGIMTVALALNASIAGLGRLEPPRRLEDFSYSDEGMARVILKSADDIDFVGLQGRVLIENGQQERDKIFIGQAQGTTFQTVMIYETRGQSLESSGFPEIKWKGQHVPVDGVTLRTVTWEVSSTLRAGLFSLASVGAVIALVFLFLNVRFKHKRVIKMSSPPLSNLTVVGCLLLYASVFATGWDKTDLSDAAIIIKCHIERLLVSLGVSFAFGSVFMRTYRIHAIFALAVKRFKMIDLPNWKLIGGVLTLVLVDCVIFTAWIAVDTTAVYNRTLESHLNMTEPEKEIFHVPVIRYCSSAHEPYFVAALYFAKGVLLVFGLFLAWETRNVAVSQLNDSKYIAASVYLVALTIALVVPTMTVLGDDVNLTYAIPGVAIVVVNTFVLCLNFIPKVYLLLTTDEKNISTSLMQSLGYGESSVSASTGSSRKGGFSKLAGLGSKLDQKQAKLQQLCEKLQNTWSRGPTGDATNDAAPRATCN